MQRVNIDHDHKPVLRLPAEEDFERIPEALRAKIMAQLGVNSWNRDNFTIRIISADELYAPHYIRRVQSMNEAAQFLLTHLPKHKIAANSLQRTLNVSMHGDTRNAADLLLGSLKEMSSTAAEVCAAHLASLDTNDIRHYQNSLYNYRRYICETLSVALGIELKEFMNALDRAEQFALLSHTRPSVCTISRLSTNHDEIIAQIDEPLNPFSPELKKRLDDIKQGNHTNAPWYDLLDDYEKAFLHAFLGITLIQDLGTRVNSISSRLRLIPAPANYGKHTLITCTLNPDENETLTTHSPEIRSSHIASRDIPQNKLASRKTHAIENLYREVEVAIENEYAKRQHEPRTDTPIIIPILYQTLITPLLEPDASLEADKETAIQAINYHLNKRYSNKQGPNLSFVLFATNHPLNYGRVATPFLSPENSQSIKHLIQHAIDNPHSCENVSLAQNAIHKLARYHGEYSRILNSYSELYFTAMEQIIVSLQGGISIGSCVSGKDRKAVEIIHTDAMKIYYSKYHSLPPLYPENEADKIAMGRFAAIFADLYCTKHQAVMADFNAPGSFGTKTPDMYLPAHLREAVTKWYQNHNDNDIYAGLVQKNIFKESDILASNNDIDHIKLRKLDPKQADLSWKSSTYMPAITLVHAAILAFQDYQEIKRSSSGILGIWKSDHGATRAMCYEQLFRDEALVNEPTSTQDQLVKAIILHALFTTNSGSVLKDTILSKSPISSKEHALEILQNFIEFELRHTDIKFNEIEDLSLRIQNYIEKMNSPTDIPAIIVTIKKELQTLIDTLKLTQSVDDASSLSPRPGHK